MGRYVVALAQATRRHPDVQAGVSPRGSLALLGCARGLALLRGRDFVTPDDVKALAHMALDHRMTIRPELWLSGVSGATVVDAALAAVPVPDQRWER